MWDYRESSPYSRFFCLLNSRTSTIPRHQTKEIRAGQNKNNSRYMVELVTRSGKETNVQVERISTILDSVGCGPLCLLGDAL